MWTKIVIYITINDISFSIHYSLEEGEVVCTKLVVIQIAILSIRMEVLGDYTYDIFYKLSTQTRDLCKFDILTSLY